jgi:nucleoside-diphosphate-sugar epimerase
LEILILGCGFTGQRVARRFLARGAAVTVTTRDPRRLADVGAKVIRLEDVAAHVRPGVLVVHSLPPEGSEGALELLGSAPSRVVYLSSTAVYGAAAVVDENTPPDEASPRAQVRLAVERSIAQGPWSSLVLRPAAIYGPGRGAHESLRRGVYSAGDNFVSRIHVDDLAAHVEAGLLSEVCGAYPVADQEPSTTREIAEFCAQLLDLPAVASGSPARITGNRRVDGSAIRRALGITLAYPSFRVGIPAALGMHPPGTKPLSIVK